MTETQRWVYFILVFLCGIGMALTLMAVPPAMGLLIEHYGVGAGTAGWFMSMGSLASTVVAMFAGAIQNKLNPKGLLLLGMACICISDVVCFLAGSSIIVMFVGRFIFGLGMGTINVAGPTLIGAIWEDPQKRSLPNAIWACFASVGSIVMLNSFTTIAPIFGGWQAGFVVAGIFSVVVAVLCAVFARIPKASLMAVAGGEGDQKGKFMEAIKSPDVISMFFMFIAFGFIFSSWSAMSPTYIQVGVGMEAGFANTIASLTTFAGVFGSIIIGVILAKVKNQPLVCLVVMVAMAIFGALEYVFVDPVPVIFEAIIIGFICGMAPPAFTLNVQWACKDQTLLGVAIAFTSSFGVGIGGIFAAPAVGALFDSTGVWALASVPLAAVGVVGVIFAILFAKRCGKKSVETITTLEAEKAEQ